MATREWRNRRTGEMQRVPQGIDPGFAHNPRLLDPGIEGQAFLERAAARAGMPDAARGASRWMAAGREIRRQLDAEVGGDLDAAGYPDRFRAALRRRLRDERGAGTVEPDVAAVDPDAIPGVPGHHPGDHAGAASRVADAARGLPASWVRAGNGHDGVWVARQGARGGSYNPDTRVIVTDGTPSNALHEYVHHLQHAMPEVQEMLLAEHVRRTTRPDGSRIPAGGMMDYEGKPWVTGRDDDYAVPYAGRDYPDYGDALEVWTVHMQSLIHDFEGREMLRDMLRRDPAMVDLMLGLLLRYDP